MLEHVGRRRQPAFATLPMARCLLPAGLILLVSFHALADSSDDHGLGDWSAFNSKTWTWTDPSPGKVIASPTALTHEKGTLGFDFSTYWDAELFGFGLAPCSSFFDIYFGITKNFEIMLQTYIPLGFLGFGLYPKASVEVHDLVTLGWTMDFGFAWAYFLKEDIEKVSDEVWMIVGGAPMIITIGSPNHFLNLSVHTMLYRNYPEGCFLTSDYTCYEERESVSNMFVVLTSLGASLRISKRVKINIDFWYIFIHGSEEYYYHMNNNHIFMPMAGLKIFGKDMWGSVGLLILVGFNDHRKEIEAFLPIPAVSFGWNYKASRSSNLQGQGPQILPPVF